MPGWVFERRWEGDLRLSRARNAFVAGCSAHPRSKGQPWRAGVALTADPDRMEGLPSQGRRELKRPMTTVIDHDTAEVERTPALHDGGLYRAGGTNTRSFMLLLTDDGDWRVEGLELSFEDGARTWSLYTPSSLVFGP
jgi:hypothetical protein